MRSLRESLTESADDREATEPRIEHAKRRFGAASARRTRHVPGTLVCNSSALLSDETFQPNDAPRSPYQDLRGAKKEA